MPVDKEHARIVMDACQRELCCVETALKEMEFPHAVLGASFLCEVNIEEACRQVKDGHGAEDVRREVRALLTAAQNIYRMAVHMQPKEARS